jgi:hypothetical protein
MNAGTTNNTVNLRKLEENPAFVHHESIRKNPRLCDQKPALNHLSLVRPRVKM